MTEAELGPRLRAAIKAGDAWAVRDLLRDGADPNALDADGLPVLCLAVAAYDAPVAEALVDGGADPGHELPDGTTPLLRAVEGGSPATVEAVLGAAPLTRLPEADRAALLALARTWYEEGAVAELRRRAGVRGPVTTVRVHDDAHGLHWVERVSVGGAMAVRAGHGAVLTSLETSFGVRVPVDELVARAVGRFDEDQDEDHVDWWAACSALADRRGPGASWTWSAVTAHRHAPDLAYRRFAADYLWMRGVYDLGPEWEEKDCEVLVAWAADETDGAVLARLLDAYTEREHRDGVAVGLRYADHPDPRVRREVPYLLCAVRGARTSGARDAVRTLLRDPDPGVRLAACVASAGDAGLRAENTGVLLGLLADAGAEPPSQAVETLAVSPDRNPAVADALYAALGAADPVVRLEAAYGLAMRDDRRTADAYARVEPLLGGSWPDHRVNALREWSRRRDAAGAAG
ncbi:ankyrin repeat domain-containing protein [Streptomyces sp. SGAir0957]